MRREALRRLLRIRAAATDDAKRALAESLAAEEAAEREVTEVTARLAAETELACDPDSGDRLVEAYVAWLPTGRRLAASAAARRDAAMAAVTVARTALGLARGAERAIAQALERVEAEEARQRSRREVAALDEIGGRPGGET